MEKRCGLSLVLVLLVLFLYGVVVFFICREYYERKVDNVSSAYEKEMVRRARYERDYLDSVIMFIRESDSVQYWERVRKEIEYAKRVANGER